MLAFYLPNVTLGKYHGAITMGTQFSEEEKAYRRGFDQGVAFLLMDLGLPNNVIQEHFYKRRVSWWRQGRIIFSNLKRDPGPRMSEKEAADLRELLLLFLQGEPTGKKDA